jgi:hypothetical protein
MARGDLVEAGVIQRIQNSALSLTVHFPPERNVVSGEAPLSRPLNPFLGPLEEPEYELPSGVPSADPVTMRCLFYDTLSIAGARSEHRDYGIGVYVAEAEAVARVLVSDAVSGSIVSGAGTVFDGCDYVECRGKQYQVRKVEPVAAGFRVPVTLHVWLVGDQR